MKTFEVGVQPGSSKQAECFSDTNTATYSKGCEALPFGISPELKVSASESVSLTEMSCGAKSEHSNDMDVEVANETSSSGVESSYICSSQAAEHWGDIDMTRSNPCSSVLGEISGCKKEQDDSDMAKSAPSLVLPNGFSGFDKDSYVSEDYQNLRGDSEHVDAIECKSIAAKDNVKLSNGYASSNIHDMPVEDGGAVFSGVGSCSSETSSAEMHQLKRRLPFYSSEAEEGNELNKMESAGNKLIK